MALTRVPQASDTDITVQFYVDGDPTDATGDVDVTVESIDGTPITTDTATSTGDTGEYYFTLDTTTTADLNLLKVTWDATVDGLAQQIVEWVDVAGGFLFTLAEARQVDGLDGTKFTDNQIAEGRTLVETALEKALGFACVPRYAYETVTTYQRDTTLRLGNPYVRSVRTVDGAATDATVSGSRQLYLTSGWDEGRIVVGYEHGLDYPPPEISRAALLLARSWLIDGPVDDRVTTMTNEDGTFNLFTPALRGVRFDLPEVQAVVNEYRLKSDKRMVSAPLVSGW